MDPVSLALGLVAGGSAAGLLARSREHRKRPRRGLSDLLPYFLFYDGRTILNKDGSFMRAWSYRGPDMATVPDLELNAISEQVNAALRPYDDGWMFHVDAIRRPSTKYDPGKGFQSASAKLLDEERRKAYADVGAHFETECAIVVTYSPPDGLSSKLGKGIVKNTAQNDTNAFEREMESAYADFARDVESFEDRLGSVLVKLKPLQGGDFLRHLHYCITGHNHPVAVPPPEAYLSRLLASEPLVGGLEPRIGSREISTISVTGFPNFTQMGMLDDLGELGVPYRWSTRFIPLGNEAAQAVLRKARKQWLGKRDGLKKLVFPSNGPADAPDPDAELYQDGNAGALGRDAAEGLSLSSSKEVRFGYYTSVIVLYGDDRRKLDEVGRRVLKSLRTTGLTARVDDYNAMEAYLGTIPGLSQNINRPLLHTRNLSHLLPLTAPWPGEAVNPCGLFPEGSPPLVYAKTDGTTPFRLNIHDDDIGHTLIVGSTGAGKSVLVGELALQFLRYENAQTFVFDVGYAHYLGCLACGGRHYDLMAPAGSGPGGTDQGEGPTFQPLAGIDDPTERAWALEWVMGLLQAQKVECTPEQRDAVSVALERVATSEPRLRTMFNLKSTVQDARVRDALRPYTRGDGFSEPGVYSSLFDGDEDGIAMGRQQVFEMKHVLDMSPAVVSPTLTYLFHRLEQRLDGSPTLIVIEEAWSALMNGPFSDKLREWLLTLRKRNASVVIVGHSPAQFQGENDAEGAKLQMLASSCYTKIYLPNPEAAEPRTAAHYNGLGLNDKEVQVLAGATKKRDYLLKNTKGTRLFQLGWGPVAAALLASRPGLSMEQTLKKATAMAEEQGESWFAEWLGGLGHDDLERDWHRLQRTLQGPEGGQASDAAEQRGPLERSAVPA